MTSFLTVSSTAGFEKGDIIAFPPEWRPAKDPWWIRAWRLIVLMTVRYEETTSMMAVTDVCNGTTLKICPAP